jgi:eukaryotic-like serine/threonine-protein kinase
MKTTCQLCGESFVDSVGSGVCTACILLKGITEEHDETLPSISSQPIDTTPLPDPVYQSFGPYELRREIAHGGMGIVYQAYQPSLNRMAAIKMLLHGPWASPEQIERFQREAESAAQIKHPNIVTIFEVGEVEGQPFIAMEYIEGIPLSEKLKGSPFTPARAAELLRTVALAIHCAHEHGIVHRDLKPSNILIDSQGQPQITDFGLAKRMDDDTNLTLTGQVLGSPNYLPPEHVFGEKSELKPESDIYAMGVILYELLTGRPPFMAESVHETLVQIREREPVALRLLSPTVPKDLETICLKCLRKEPNKRYFSAQELADELKRFQNGEPIVARPLSTWGRLVGWRRRNPGLALAIAMVLLVFLAGFLTTWSQWLRAEAHAEKSDERLLQLYTANGERQLDAGHHFDALSWFGEAFSLAKPESSESASLRFRIENLLATTPRQARRFLHTNPIRSLRFSSDERLLLTASRDGVVRMWHMENDQEPRFNLPHTTSVGLADFNATGSLFVTGSNSGDARVWQSQKGTPLTDILPHDSPLIAAAFSPGDQFLFTTSGIQTEDRHVGHLTMWSLPAGEQIHQLDFEDPVISIDLRPGIPELVIGLANGQNAGKAIAFRFTEKGLSEPLWQAAGLQDEAVYSPNGDYVSLTTYEPLGGARVLRATDGSIIGSAVTQRHNINSVAFDSTSTSLIYADESSNAIAALDIARGELSLGPLAIPGRIGDMLLSPDGHWIACVIDWANVAMYDSKRGFQALVTLPHDSIIEDIRFSPSSRFLGVGNRNGEVIVWEMPMPRHKRVLTQRQPSLNARFNADGSAVALSDAIGRAALIEVTGEPASSQPSHHRAAIWDLEFDPSGHRWVEAGLDGWVKVYDGQTGKAISPPLEAGSPVLDASFSPDGKRVATASIDGQVRVWTVAQGTLAFAPLAHASFAHRVVFTPNGQKIITVSHNQRLSLWNGKTGAKIGDFGLEQVEVTDLAVTQNSQRVVVAYASGRIQAFELDTLSTFREDLFHTSTINSIALNNNGTRLASGDAEGHLRLWDWPSGRAVCPPIDFQDSIRKVVFSSDGHLLAACSDDRTVQLFDGHTGGTMALPWRLKDPVHHLEFNPDATQLLMVGWSAGILLWDLPSIPISDEDLPRAARWHARKQVDSFGRQSPAPTEHLSRDSDLLITRYPQLFQSGASKRSDWHWYTALETNESRPAVAAFHWKQYLATLTGDETEISSRRSLARTHLELPNTPSLRTKELPIRNPLATANQLDLTELYNARLDENWHQGLPNNDLGTFPIGLNQFAGVTFDARGIVQLSSQIYSRGYERVEIPVGRAANQIHILHSMGYGGGYQKGIVVGRLKCHYEGGESTVLEIRNQIHCNDWWAEGAGLSVDDPNSTLAWVGTNVQVYRRLIRLLGIYRTTWDLPNHSESIERIEYESAMNGPAPFLLAVTTE